MLSQREEHREHHEIPRQYFDDVVYFQPSDHMTEFRITGVIDEYEACPTIRVGDAMSFYGQLSFTWPVRLHAYFRWLRHVLKNRNILTEHIKEELRGLHLEAAHLARNFLPNDGYRRQFVSSREARAAIQMLNISTDALAYDETISTPPKTLNTEKWEHVDECGGVLENALIHVRDDSPKGKYAIFANKEMLANDAAIGVMRQLKIDIMFLIIGKESEIFSHNYYALKQSREFKYYLPPVLGRYLLRAMKNRGRYAKENEPDGRALNKALRKYKDAIVDEDAKILTGDSNSGCIKLKAGVRLAVAVMGSSTAAVYQRGRNLAKRLRSITDSEIEASNTSGAPLNPRQQFG